MSTGNDAQSGAFPQNGEISFDPADFRGVLTSRVLAFLGDFLILALITIAGWVIFGILGFLTFGLAWLGLQLVAPVVFFGYFALTLGGEHSATPGMRFQGIHARTWDGRKPGILQAFVQTLLFYLTVSILTPLILLVPLFNRRKRALHDYLSGMVIVRDRNLR